MLTSSKILLIDDEPEFLETTNNILRQSNENYELLNATNANYALQIVSSEKPDLIITDWEMPNMSGIELIKILIAYKSSDYLQKMLSSWNELVDFSTFKIKSKLVVKCLSIVF